MRTAGALGICFCLLLGPGGASQAGDRETAMALLGSAEGLIKQGLYDKALDICLRAVEADETCAEAHLQSAQCLAQLSRPREALRSFKAAQALAQKAGDKALAEKVQAAATKACAGLLALDQADQKLVEKLLPIAQEALAAGRWQTAGEAFECILALCPDHARAKEGAEQARKELEARGPPLQARLADALLRELWYQLGAGKKDEARKLAGELSQRYPTTAAGGEAAELVARELALPEQLDDRPLIDELAAIQAARPKAVPKQPAADAPSLDQMDILTFEKATAEDVGKLARDKLAAAFQDARRKADEYYAKAAPGTEGCHAGLLRALEQLLRARLIAERLEKEQLKTPELEPEIQQASLVRYTCLRMLQLGR
jgi:tetratricopeptide (TPR) repeat protein